MPRFPYARAKTRTESRTPITCDSGLPLLKTEQPKDRLSIHNRTRPRECAISVMGSLLAHLSYAKYVGGAMAKSHYPLGGTKRRLQQRVQQLLGRM